MLTRIGASRIPLRGFGVRNFKAFRDRQQIPIRPITLLFGKNNCGKSAMLRALAYAGQLTEEYSEDNTEATAEGLAPTVTDATSWPRFLHDPERTAMSFFFQLGSTLPWLANRLVTSLPSVTHELEVGLTQQKMDEPPWDSALLRTVQVRKWVDSELLLSGDDINLSGPTIQRLLDHATQVASADSSVLVPRELLEVLVKAILKPAADQGAFPPDTANYQLVLERLRGPAQGLWTDELSAHDDAWGALAETLGRRPPARECEALYRALQHVASNLESLWGDLSGALGDLRYRMSYLGPLRTIPNSVQWSSAVGEGTGAKYWERVAADAEVRSRMNEWLARCKGDRVSVHVELHGAAIGLAESDLDSTVKRMLPLAKRALSARRREVREDRSVTMPMLSGMTPGDLARMWAEQLLRASSEAQSARVLIEAEGVKRLLQPVEVGLGWAQFIPVLAAAEGSTGQINLVEQPELHLHPALQAEAGDMFISSALGPGQNTWVIETHSEHLLLRIMRRIRETTRGKLPEGVPPITPRDVSVCFVERDGGASAVHEIPLDENGIITRPWPGGFFEEGFREVFA